jgi:pimeloyl-ACP methyl ester carboxylesterase
MQATLKVGDSVINLEYELGSQLVVFSHGFGVRHDGRGLFTDIAQAFPRGWGFVMFDYDAVDTGSNVSTLVGFAERSKILQAILKWAHQQEGVAQVHVVGHSFGTMTVANVAPEDVGAIILLAPPLSLGSRFAERYTKRTGSEHDGHTWKIPRTDGSTTVVDDEVLAELVSVDAEGELAKLALFRPYTIVLAGTDEVIPDADYTELITLPSVTMEGVERADHDFSGEARHELVELVLRLLKEPVSGKHKVD